MKKILCALAAAGAFAPLTEVHALTFNYIEGIVHETNAFANFNTSGAEMAGMGVHVEYVNGSTHDAALQLVGPGFGRVNDGSVYLQVGNTGNSTYSWLLYNIATLGIRSVSFDGQPGNTVFDSSGAFGQFVGFNFVGTPGTAGGRDFDLNTPYRNYYNGITVTYSDAVALAGTDPVGDVFRRMTIEFALDRPMFAQGLIEFMQDTDSLAFGSVLAPLAPPSVPEGGATLAMFCAGLAGLAMCARRRVVHP